MFVKLSPVPFLFPKHWVEKRHNFRYTKTVSFKWHSMPKIHYYYYYLCETGSCTWFGGGHEIPPKLDCVVQGVIGCWARGHCSLANGFAAATIDDDPFNRWRELSVRRCTCWIEGATRCQLYWRGSNRSEDDRSVYLHITARVVCWYWECKTGLCTTHSCICFLC